MNADLFCLLALQQACSEGVRTQAHGTSCGVSSVVPLHAGLPYLDCRPSQQIGAWVGPCPTPLRGCPAVRGDVTPDAPSTATRDHLPRSTATATATECLTRSTAIAVASDCLPRSTNTATAADHLPRSRAAAANDLPRQTAAAVESCCCQRSPVANSCCRCHL